MESKVLVELSNEELIEIIGGDPFLYDAGYVLRKGWNALNNAVAAYGEYALAHPIKI